MRTYGQYCGLAKALDVVGDRWTLLIVRELLARGACRYTDLREGLPGIATNLLAERLKDLEDAGVLQREETPPPVAATLLRLTPRGEALLPALMELGRWGAPLLAKPGKKDRFRSHWLALPIAVELEDQTPEAAPVSIELRSGEEPFVIEARDGGIHTRSGAAERPDLILSGPGPVLTGVLFGKLDVFSAPGLKYQGDPAVLRRLQKRPMAAS